jgi:hypothetical protein
MLINGGRKKEVGYAAKAGYVEGAMVGGAIFSY